MVKRGNGDLSFRRGERRYGWEEGAVGEGKGVLWGERCKVR